MIFRLRRLSIRSIANATTRTLIRPIGIMNAPPRVISVSKSIPDGDGNLLDSSLILYGSPMGDSNLHNHKRCPLFVVGGAQGRLAGNQHIKTEDGRPMADAMLGVAHALGMDDLETFGDDGSKPLSLS